MAVEQDCLPLLLWTKYHLKTNLAELEVINQSLPQSLHSGLVWAPFSDPAQALWYCYTRRMPRWIRDIQRRLGRVKPRQENGTSWMAYDFANFAKGCQHHDAQLNAIDCQQVV